MDYILILKAILATMELVGRIAESRTLDPEELEAYITQRNAVRLALVTAANKLASEQPPSEPTADPSQPQENTEDASNASQNPG
jgi:hypothetical protein